MLKNSLVRSFVLGLAGLMPVSAMAQMDEVTADKYLNETVAQRASYIRSFADDYASNFDRQTAERIREYYGPKDQAGISEGVAGAFSYASTTLQRLASKNIPMTNVGMNRILGKCIDDDVKSPSVTQVSYTRPGQ